MGGEKVISAYSRGPHRFPVDDGRAEAADCVAEIDCVGIAEVLEGEGLFFGVGICGEEAATMDAGKYATVDGWGEEAAIFLDEEVVDGGLCDFVAVIEEEDFVVAGFDCGLESRSV